MKFVKAILASPFYIFGLVVGFIGEAVYKGIAKAEEILK